MQAGCSCFGIRILAKEIRSAAYGSLHLSEIPGVKSRKHTRGQIEKLVRVKGYVKNNGLGFEVPYTFLGDEHAYRPDFIVLVDDGQPDPLKVVVEIKGDRGPDAEAKRDALSRLWVPAVNNDGRWGRWQAIEIVEPTDMTLQFTDSIWGDAKQGTEGERRRTGEVAAA